MVQESSGFSFGTVEDTQIVICQNEAYLPYNPFTFDMYLKITKTAPTFEAEGKQYAIQAGKKVVFGRKNGQAEVILKAPTISGKHFSIGQDQKLYDMGSTKGTFKWISREKPKLLYTNDIVLVGKVQFTITMVDRQKCEVHIRNQQTKQHLIAKRSPFHIGSYKNCHQVIPGLKDYHAVINPNQGTLTSMVQDQDMSRQNGVWERLSPAKLPSKAKNADQGQMVMAFPYVFTVHF